MKKDSENFRLLYKIRKLKKKIKRNMKFFTKRIKKWMTF